MTPPLAHRVATLMGDNRPRTTADVARATSATPEDADVALRLLVKLGLVSVENNRVHQRQVYQSTVAKVETPPVRRKTPHGTDDEFLMLWNRDTPGAVMAELLKYASPESISSRARRLGLPKRPPGRRPYGTDAEFAALWEGGTPASIIANELGYSDVDNIDRRRVRIGLDARVEQRAAA